jgi:hypothetical protein
MAAVGFSSVLAFVTARRKQRSHKRSHIYAFEIISALVLIAAICLTNFQREKDETSGAKFFASHMEFDRAEAGRWVDKNVPDSFRVLTYWGNPAYFSHRHVIDGSFLNRDFNEGIPLGKDSVEVMILCREGPNVNPSEPVADGDQNWLREAFGEDTASKYTAVKVFDKTFSAGPRYFYVVFIRNDVLHEVKNIDVLDAHRRPWFSQRRGRTR